VIFLFEKMNSFPPRLVLLAGLLAVVFGSVPDQAHDLLLVLALVVFAIELVVNLRDVRQSPVISRRATERMIESGLVEINGKTVTELGTKARRHQSMVGIVDSRTRVARRLSCQQGPTDPAKPLSARV
jgi:S4 domain